GHLMLARNIQVNLDKGLEERRETGMFDNHMPVTIASRQRFLSLGKILNRINLRLIAPIQVSTREPERSAIANNHFDVVSLREDFGRNVRIIPFQSPSEGHGLP